MKEKTEKSYLKKLNTFIPVFSSLYKYSTKGVVILLFVQSLLCFQITEYKNNRKSFKREEWKVLIKSLLKQISGNFSIKKTSMKVW